MGGLRYNGLIMNFMRAYLYRRGVFTYLFPERGGLDIRADKRMTVCTDVRCPNCSVISHIHVQPPFVARCPSCQEMLATVTVI